MGKKSINIKCPSRYIYKLFNIHASDIFSVSKKTSALLPLFFLPPVHSWSILNLSILKNVD